jgi:aromatic ring hydroxylase
MAVRQGKDYVEALRDGRQVWHAGRRIEDVTCHPGFAGTVATLASLYDLQHSTVYGPTMTTMWEGERTSYSYYPPTTAQELAAKRRNVELWSERTFGVMGFYARSKRVRDQPDPDLILHVIRETSEGVVVRGLRNLATLAPLSDEALVYPNRPRAPDEEDYALAFAIPMNAPGLTIICRDLYAEHADPERLPLSARFDEVDATLIFDDVLVPWERIFVYRNPALATRFHGLINLWAGYSTLVRLLSKLEVFIAVADLLTQWAGSAKDRGVQVRVGQLLSDAEVLRAPLTLPLPRCAGEREENLALPPATEYHCRAYEKIKVGERDGEYDPSGAARSCGHEPLRPLGSRTGRAHSARLPRRQPQHGSAGALGEARR